MDLPILLETYKAIKSVPADEVFPLNAITVDIHKQIHQKKHLK